MEAININSNTWTQFELQVGNYALISQEDNVVYYAEENNPSVFMQIKEIVGTLQAPRTIWLKTQYGESVVFYTQDLNTIGGFGNGGGGTAYTFSQPLSESGGTVSLQITNNLKLTGGKLDVGNSVVLTSGNQSIAGGKTFTETLILRGTARGSGNLKLERPENEPVYISLGDQTNNSSIAYFGFLSSNSTIFAFENLKSGGTFEFRNPVVFNGAISNNKQFVTKEYVDNKIQVRTLAQGTEPEASSIPNGSFVAVIYS